jgi:hypothetical protein
MAVDTKSLTCAGRGKVFIRLIAVHLFAAIVVTGWPGLVVAKPPALPAPSPDPGCVIDTATGATFVADKVRFLPAGGFNFNGNGGSPYSGPTVGSAVDPSSSYAKVFADAFKAAPPFLQQELCNNLNYVFVDQSNQGDVIGWAFWEMPGQDNGAGRWIAIPDAFFTSGTAGTTPITNASLHVIETVILHQLLVTPTSTALSTNTLPVYSVVPPSQDTQANGLLSLMAHEMGHVLYFEKCDLPRPSPPRPGPCDTFLNSGWRNQGVRPPIHKFKDPFNGSPSHVLGEPSLDEVSQDFQQGDPEKLRRIYGLRPGNKIVWADLFAEVAPDEDFVETYKLLVLKNVNTAPGITAPKITGLTVQFTTSPTDSADIIANLANGNSVLSRKANFVSGLLP